MSYNDLTDGKTTEIPTIKMVGVIPAMLVFKIPIWKPIGLIGVKRAVLLARNCANICLEKVLMT